MKMKSHQFLRIGQVCNKTGYSRSKVYQLLKHGFPPPVHEGAMALWIAAEVDIYMAHIIKRSRAIQRTTERVS